ncbi:hypothetical protein ACYPKM_03440 [Pseudomonas aeruginosa]
MLADKILALIKAYAETGNYKAVEAFLDGMVPLSFSSKAEARKELSALYNVDDKALKSLSVRKLGMDEDVAFDILYNAVMGSAQRDEYWQAAVESIGSRAAEIIAFAAYTFDAPTVSALTKVHGYGDCETIIESPEAYSITIAGKKLRIPDSITEGSISSEEDVFVCLDALKKYGFATDDIASERIRCLINAAPGGTFTSDETLKISVEDLPRFEKGSLVNPDLAIAFSHLKFASIFNSLFDCVPVVVDASEVCEFTDCLIFGPVQAVCGNIDFRTEKNYYATPRNYCEMPEEFEVTSNSEAGVVRSKIYKNYFQIISGLDAYRVPGSYKESYNEDMHYSVSMASALLAEITDDGLLKGYAIDKKQRIVMMPLSKASNFIDCAPSLKIADMIDRVKSLTLNRTIVEILNSRVNHHVIHKIGIKEGTIDDLISSITKDNSGRLRKIFGDEFLRKSLVGKESLLCAKSLVFARDELGHDFSSAKIMVRADELDYLLRCNFQLTSPNCENHYNSVISTFEQKQAWLKLGGWYSNLEKPKSIKDAIALAMRTKAEDIYQVFLSIQDIAEVMDCCTTDRQREVMATIFPAKEVMLHKDKFSRSIRTKLAGSTLNI